MSIWRCPICQEPLHREEHTWICSNRHSFDQARSGYVNLLPVNQKRTKQPGDNKQMVHARTQFLDAGYYSVLREAVAQCVTAHAADHGVLLDVGCGEGYYLQGVTEALQQAGKRLPAYGIDIAKCAVDAAAKRCKEASFAVASVFHLPVQDHCCTMVLSMFAPYCGPEIERVLASGCTLIQVIPGAQHLWELKQAIYDTPYRNTVKDYALEGFSLLQVDRITKRILLSNPQDIQNLFTMTPYYYKTGVQEHEKLQALQELETEISFELIQYRKH